MKIGKMKPLFAACGTCLALSLGAAPAKVDPVAAGYPAWTGLVEKNRIAGRRLTPSDLRHRVVIVGEFDSAKAKNQLLYLSGLGQAYNRLAPDFGVGWEHRDIHCDTIVILINRGAKMTPEMYKEATSSKEKDEASKLSYMKANYVSIYEDVTFPGAPEAKGEFPYFYVMGHEGTEPIAKGKVGGKSILGDVGPAVKKGLAAMKEAELAWTPFYGTVSEPKYFKDLKLQIAKRKPLAQFSAKLKNSVTASDPEKAKEAQKLFDGLEQTRSDLVTRIELEAGACPHRAAYDTLMLVKYWPSEKKALAKKAGKGKGSPEVDTLSRAFIRIMTLKEPDFVCKSAAEAKKIVNELNAMKKPLEKLRESQNIVIQNGASLLLPELEEVIAIVPTKVPEKH